MKWLSLLLLSGVMFAQGTSIPGPLVVTVPAGTTPTSLFEFTPATTQWPCLNIAQTNHTFVFCGQPGIGMTVDLGDGNGYQSLKGAKGDPGEQGPIGPQGPPATFPTSFTCQTAVAGKGGKGVPNFSVTKLVLTNCTPN